MDKNLIDELDFCLKLWGEKGYCEFGKHTNCEECGTPYLLLKLITGEVIHGPNVNRLTLEDWKEKLGKIKNSMD